MILTDKKFQKKFQTARAAILTNQSSYIYGKGYFFEEVKKFMDLKFIFLPEHGLFAELQDQVSGSSLKYDFGMIKTVNLYGDEENSLFVKDEILDELDIIIFSIRDVGARYYTFLTSCYYILEKVSRYNKEKNRNIEIVVMDFPNPAGRKVEGTPLEKKYSSFVGVTSVLHRHGLSTAELMLYYNHEFDFHLKIYVLPHSEFFIEKDKIEFWIPPSPNIPFPTTCEVYSGQCLLEGTNLSEGRGTTRPFEIFGAPYLDISNENLRRKILEGSEDSFDLRPLFFIPTFHKHSGKVCGGYQIMVKDRKKFHSLYFTLKLLRHIQEEFHGKFSFLLGVYEFRSDLSAIELLAGDKFLLDYIFGVYTDEMILEYLKESEKEWKKKLDKFLIR